MSARTSFLYFSYGSNLLRERLLLNNPSAVFKSAGKLTDYKLVFLGNSGRWHGGVASIQQSPGDAVWGVVWTMGIADQPNLDRQEGIYTPMEVDVSDSDGASFACRTYQLRLTDWTESPGPPSPHYKDVIVRGARQNRLPESYLRLLESIRDNGFTGAVPVYDDVLKLIADSDPSPPS